VVPGGINEGRIGEAEVQEKFPESGLVKPGVETPDKAAENDAINNGGARNPGLPGGQAPRRGGKPLGKEVLAERVEGAKNLEWGTRIVDPPLLLKKADLLHDKVERERFVIRRLALAGAKADHVLIDPGKDAIPHQPDENIHLKHEGLDNDEVEGERVG
jgi:hypothetical protein